MANDQHRGGTGHARANGGTDLDYSAAGMDCAGRIGVGNVSLGNFIVARTPAPSPFGAAAEEEDDYRHRMKMNVLGFLVTILLVISGVWIADTMVEMRKLQDCFLMGGRNCAPIPVPPARHG